MENWLENICDPEILYLAWQAPDHFGIRFRWAVGVVKPRDDGYAFRYFEPGQEFESYNDGKKYEEMWALGYAGYAAFSTKVREHTSGVLEALRRRIPPRGRSDFAQYMKHFRLRGNLPLSDFSLLGRTEATLPSDGFSLVDPLNGGAECCDLMSEVAGFRYYAKEAGDIVRLGATVEVRAEPENKYDANAVVFLINGKTIGYVNRLQTGAFRQWLTTRKIEAHVERINGKVERPRVFLFVRVRAEGTQSNSERLAS
jgi:hypothetical protein